jgi:two-component system sensor histidine kinase BaeS
MNRLFVRTLLTFLAALLITVAVVGGVAIWGFGRSLREWSRTRGQQAATLARQILLGGSEAAETAVPEDTPLFVYDAQGTLVFSNRGGGGARRGAPAGADLTPVTEDSRLLGYYRTGKAQFRSDAANDRFYQSMRQTTIWGLGLALLISIPFALFFSRNLARPAIRAARGLDRIAAGALQTQVPERGAEEIARIARSANRLARQLEREQGLRRQWVQDIAHDLRTPISALGAQLEGMRDGVLELSADRIEKNVREVARLDALVSDLEELMRLESPEMVLSPGEVDAAAFSEEIRERFSGAVEQKGISCTSHSELAGFRGDETLLLRAVSNLFSNAVRHADLHGTIELSIRREGEWIVIGVANTGEQIPPEELDRVFDRLYRGEYARHTPGSGLGLTIARRIAELHGGTARVRNRPESGVLVELILPVR